MGASPHQVPFDAASLISRGPTGRLHSYRHQLSPLGLVGMVHEQRFSAFFYGTLLHPKILKRVIGNDGSHLEICPAVLLVSIVNASVRVRMNRT